MIVSMALAVTWRGDRATKFRSAVLAVAVAAVTLFVCAAASTALMADRVNQRAAERTFQQAGPDEDADLSGSSRYDSIGGDQIYVHLWRIETPGVRIPGVPAEATAGDWFVSPELARRIESEPSLQERYRGARVLGAEGVGSADELMAVRLAGPEADLDFRYVAVPGSQYSGLAAGVSVENILAGTALVLMAGIGMLRAALGPASAGLERRVTLLSLLGAGTGRLWQLQAVTTAVVAMPAATAAAVAWYLISPRLTAVPLVGQKVLKGDLAMPIWAVVAAAAAVVALTALVGLRRPHRRWGSRPTLGVPASPGRGRLLGLTVPLVLILSATTLSGTGAAPRLFIAGLVAAVVAVVVALPVLLDWLGARLAQGRSALELLVGRSLSCNARVSARSLTALASVTVLVPAAASYIATARAHDPPPPVSQVEVIRVIGELDDEVLDWFEREADGVFAEEYATRAAILNLPSTFTLVADCGSLKRYVALQSCGPDGIVVGTEAASTFARYDAAATKPPAGATRVSWLFITNDGERAEDVLRSHMVNSDDYRMSVTSRADWEFKESRSVPWILAAIQVGAIGAAAALLLSVVTNSAHSARMRLRLVGIGADLRMIRRLASAESAAVVGIVGLGGTAVGTVGAVAYGLVNGSEAPIYLPSVVLAIVVAAAAAASALASAVCVSGGSLQDATAARD